MEERRTSNAEEQEEKWKKFMLELLETFFCSHVEVFLLLLLPSFVHRLDGLMPIHRHGKFNLECCWCCGDMQRVLKLNQINKLVTSNGIEKQDWEQELNQKNDWELELDQKQDWEQELDQKQDWVQELKWELKIQSHWDRLLSKKALKLIKNVFKGQKLKVFNQNNNF